MFSFKITKTKNGRRYGEIYTNHGRVMTPFFMPCATVGSVKAVSPAELKEIGYKIILANTYHLYLRPGEKTIQNLGGMHKFMNWQGPILTDSGGFQVFSLKPKMGERGVKFSSHLDGSKHFFTPEKVIDIQLALGSDIIMPLDVCPPGDASRREAEKAVRLTLKWLHKSIKHLNRCHSGRGEESHSISIRDSSSRLRRIQNDKKEIHKPALFGIIQGGIYDDLREECAREIIKMDLPGCAIGGLAVGEKKEDMKRIARLMNKVLPKNKPRYLMGIGEPEDLIWATANGMDMFDCVLPTRLGRHGSVWIKEKSKCKSQNAKLQFKIQKLDLTKSKFKNDSNPIQKKCGCYACNGRDGNEFSRAYIHHLLKEKEILGVRLTTLHNLWFIKNLMNNLSAGGQDL